MSVKSFFSPFFRTFSQIVSLDVLGRMTVWLSKRSTYKWLSAIFHWIYVIWFISCLLSHYHMLWSLAHATLVWASCVKDEISCHKIYLVIFGIKRKKEEAFLVDEGMKWFGADFRLNVKTIDSTFLTLLPYFCFLKLHQNHILIRLYPSFLLNIWRE